MTTDPRINPTDLAADADRHWYWGDNNGWRQWHWTYTHIDPCALPNFVDANGETYVITPAPEVTPVQQPAPEAAPDFDALPFPATEMMRLDWHLLSNLFAAVALATALLVLL